jgi:hypothetical protein
MFVLAGISITFVTLVADASPSFGRIDAILLDQATTRVVSPSPEASR